ncbi:MFS family permease [Thermosulfuriphilus ammonigenes]|nr:MFS transporter [Thermosulfuriphilus ammonigenes]MBA2847662.1 MFS family permease [Thermosulfuriphilus ammonigenes]
MSKISAPPSPMLVIPGLSALAALAISTVHFFMPVYLKGKLGFSGQQIGLLYGALSVTTLITAFPFGLASDRLKARDLVALALLLLGGAIYLQAQVSHFTVYFLAFLIYGLGLNLFRIALDALLFKTVSERTGKSFGIFNGSRMAGFTLGGILGGVLLDRLDFVFTLKTVAGFYLLLLAFYPWLPRTTPVRFRIITYQEDFVRRPVVFFALWLLLFYLHWGAEFTSYGLFLRKSLGLSLTGMGLYMSAEFATVGLASVGGGLLLHRGLAIEHLALAGLFASGVGHIGMVWPQVPISLAFRLVHGLGDGFIAVVSYVGIARLFRIERIGGNAGLITFSIMLGSFIGSLIFGPLGERYGYGTPLAISGLITLGLIPLALIYRWHTSPEPSRRG